MSAEREHHTYRLPKRTLSRREQEVVVLLCEGYSYRGIGNLLGSVESTIKTQVWNVIRKLGLKTRAGLVRWAVETGVGQREASE